MKLRAIPPANRQRIGTTRLSSMRASVGRASTDSSDWTVQASVADAQALRERQAFRQALTAKREQLQSVLGNLLQNVDEHLLAEAKLIKAQLEKLEERLL